MMQLFNWFRRGSLERELDHELQYHFDRRVADLSESGVPEPEARRRVAAELGLAQVREEVRDVWLTRWSRDFLYDLRFSARSFLRSPALPRRRCSRWPSASALRPPSTRWSTR